MNDSNDSIQYFSYFTAVPIGRLRKKKYISEKCKHELKYITLFFHDQERRFTLAQRSRLTFCRAKTATCLKRIRRGKIKFWHKWNLIDAIKRRSVTAISGTICRNFPQRRRDGDTVQSCETCRAAITNHCLTELL
jgi:hypothetical protein